MNAALSYDTALLFVAENSQQELQSLRLYLVSCDNGEVKRHFAATFAHLSQMKSVGYSLEAMHPYRQALLEILVELRVRGLEADGEGNLYHPDHFYPVPKHFGAARQRQIRRLSSLHIDLLGHLCNKTLLQYGRAATRNSKAVY